MTKKEKIDFYSNQKQKAKKSARLTKAIGTLSACISIATISAFAYQSIANDTNSTPLATVGAVTYLIASMSLRISKIEAEKIKRLQKQIRKIKKQR